MMAAPPSQLEKVELSKTEALLAEKHKQFIAENKQRAMLLLLSVSAGSVTRKVTAK